MPTNKVAQFDRHSIGGYLLELFLEAGLGGAWHVAQAAKQLGFEERLHDPMPSTLAPAYVRAMRQTVQQMKATRR